MLEMRGSVLMSLGERRSGWIGGEAEEEGEGEEGGGGAA